MKMIKFTLIFFLFFFQSNKVLGQKKILGYIDSTNILLVLIIDSNKICVNYGVYPTFILDYKRVENTFYFNDTLSDIQFKQIEIKDELIIVTINNQIMEFLYIRPNDEKLTLDIVEKRQRLKSRYLKEINKLDY